MYLAGFNRKLAVILSDYSRDRSSVALIAVSKLQSTDKIVSLYHQGQRAFGENYLNEALPKIHALSHLDINWHFIGHIQRNKTADISKYFSWVQSLDREIIAQRLNAQRPPHLPPLQICIEINASGDEKKSGIGLDKLPDLIKSVQQLPRLQWRGLMTMITEDYEKVAKVFFDLKKQGYAIDTLSMGMSGDYPRAIAAGSTMIRIGQKLFGERKQSL